MSGGTNRSIAEISSVEMILWPRLDETEGDMRWTGGELPIKVRHGRVHWFFDHLWDDELEWIAASFHAAIKD